MPYELHPIYHYAQNIIDAYHEKLAGHAESQLLDGVAKPSQDQPDGPALFDQTVKRCKQQTTVDAGSDPCVGIIGGGVGGLFAAMLLQHCGIHYQVLERADLGGRLYTHRFGKGDNDYFVSP